MNHEIATLQRDIQRLKQDMALRPIRVPTRGGAVSLPSRIRIGRGNSVYIAGAFAVYGSKPGQNPTSVSAGMWNSGTKQWIPADATWDDGICYGYLDNGEVVAVAQKFNSLSGKIIDPGALIEGALIYSASTTSYTFPGPGDTVTIYLVDEF